MTSSVIELTPNQPPDRFYRGGSRIADFRGAAYNGGQVPEDWLASTTTLHGERSLGLTVLPDGRELRYAVRDDPVAWLGQAHVKRWGDDTKLLTKLLDAGQRLPVHLHPDSQFARANLGHLHGKTEAWVILTPGVVHLGFRPGVSAEDIAQLVRSQDSAAMLALMHDIDVDAGDAVFVPAGCPHAIGEGILLVEVQEPEDLSILLEWDDFDLPDNATPDLGLGWDLALTALEVGRDRDAAQALVARTSVGSLLPSAADEFFRVERVESGANVSAGFAVAVAVEGSGRLVYETGCTPVRRGATVLIAHDAGPIDVEGHVCLLWCRPPLP